jgi:hypothetical protein
MIFGKSEFNLKNERGKKTFWQNTTATASKIDTLMNKKNTNDKNKSIRCIIFEKIFGGLPTKNIETSENSLENRRENHKRMFKRFATRDDLRKLWRKIISEQILLVKMERENKLCKIKADASDAIRNKFNQINFFSYIEITTCLKEVEKIWDTLLLNDEMVCHDSQEIHEIVLKGFISLIFFFVI